MEVNLRLRFVSWVVRVVVWRSRSKFECALRNPRKAQKKVLSEILKLAQHGALPQKPSQYSDYEMQKSWTSESIRFYEVTSGNSEKKKLIPYTPSLLKSFQIMFLLWVDDILTHQPLENGKLFISISPKLESLGLNSDLDYLNPVFQYLINLFIIVPKKEFVAENGDHFFFRLAFHLLKNKDLECVSIWSPSYFISLLNFIQTNAKHFENRDDIENRRWTAIWPKLKFISCWVDGSSKAQALQLQTMFPQVFIQGKGLLATEGAVSLPWARAAGCLPLWTETYLEYIDASGKIRPLYDIKPRQFGELLISTKGGLLRYQLGDVVECNGYYEKSPMIKFLRRTGDVSDLVGEKLDSTLIMNAFTEFHHINWILIANIDHYVFASDQIVIPLDIERKLKEIFHYALARELGQLKPVVTLIIENLPEKLNAYYHAKKIKLGDVKAKILWTDRRILDYLQNSKSPESFLR